VVVAIFFLCAAFGLAINTDVNISDNLATSQAASLSAQEANRIYSRLGIGACLVCLLIAAAQAGVVERALRVLKSPIVWAVAYQAIIGWHYFSDDNMWDLARLCGVWVLLMVTMAASPLMALDEYVPKMLLLFRLLLWISLVVAIVLPSNGWQQNYGDSFIPGITDRFAGVAGHANGMGAIAGIAILLELDQLLGDGTKRWLSILHLGLGNTLLLLTQSKTALIALAVCGVYLLLSRKSQFLTRGVRVLMVATVVIIGSVVAWSALSEWVTSNKDSLAELTGRTAVWKYYWELALDRPWFGYGTSLWSELLESASFQYQWAAGNAHNQLLNSFLMTGVFGVGCLIAYVRALFRSRRQMDVQYRALFTAYVLFMVIRSFAEAGFEPGDMGVAASIQTVLIGFCLCRQVSRSNTQAGGVWKALRVQSPNPVVHGSQQ
jgi:hypothetical protein